MLKIFQICFFSGLLYTVVAFLLGHIFDFIGGAHGDISSVDAHMDIDTHFDINAHLDGHIDAGNIDGHFDGHVDSGAGVSGDVHAAHVSPLKPIIIVSFVTVFGGIGSICMIKNLTVYTATAIAFISALLIAFLLHKFIITPLYRAQNTSAVAVKELIGELAIVTLPMRGTAFGKITYKANGNTYGAPARSIDDTDIEKGANVVIIEIRKNTFYVKKIKGGI